MFMKTYSPFFRRIPTLLLLLLSVAAPSIRAQGTITILGNVTRITDATTGQLVGPGFSAAIYWAPVAVSDPNAFLQLGATMNVVNGLLSGGTRTLTAPAPGGSVSVLAAAWESQHGATYEAASQVPGAKVGRSSIVQAIPGGPAVRIPDFQVAPVPEPSTWAIIGLGVLALTWRHVRSRKS